MRCLSCGSENSTDAAFCEQCGARLQIICPSCRTPAGPAAKFCRSCGASLSDDSPPKAAERASSTGVSAHAGSHGVPEGERKTVTALFADITGSSELMRNLDPEEARAIINSALQLMIDAVHQYDGYVVHTFGDDFIALFGAPVAHEDHPQRAVHAALAARDDLGRRGGAGLELRIRIHTGEVVMRSVLTGGHTEYCLIGHAINLFRDFLRSEI